MNQRTLPLSKIRQDPRNPRTHDDQNLDAIRASLEEYGQVEPLVVQKGTGRLIAGHGRFLVMRELGWEKARVVEIQLDDLQARDLAVRLNRTAELAGWDRKLLGELMAELEGAGRTRGGATGFSQSEIDDLLEGLAEIEDETTPPPDRAPEELPGPGSEDREPRAGDSWICGRHTITLGRPIGKTLREMLLEAEARGETLVAAEVSLDSILEAVQAWELATEERAVHPPGR